MIPPRRFFVLWLLGLLCGVGCLFAFFAGNQRVFYGFMVAGAVLFLAAYVVLRRN